jgi:hypothetical protein
MEFGLYGADFDFCFPNKSGCGLDGFVFLFFKRGI